MNAGVMERPEVERPTEISALGRLPTKDEYYEALAVEMRKCIYDPERFCWLVFPMGKPLTPLARFESLYPWQEELFRSIGEERRAKGFRTDGPPVMPIQRTISSGKSAGKTWAMGALAWWIMATCPWAQGLATATTDGQLTGRLWKEIRSLYNMSPILQQLFEVNSELVRHKEYPEDWKLDAVVPSKATVESLQGVHGVYTSFAVGDECSGIPPQNFDALDGMQGDPQVFQIYASNPLHRVGVWYNRTFGTERHEWSPTVVDVSKLPGKNIEQYQRVIDRLGENHRKVRIEIRGLPAKADDEQLFSEELIEKMETRPARAEGGDLIVDPGAALLCGVDLPAGGGDKFVARFRRGLDARSIPPVIPKMPGGRPMKFQEMVETCEDILDRTFTGGAFVHTMYIDDSQYGKPVYETLCDNGYRGSVALVTFAGACPDPDHYENMRAWMYVGMSEWGRGRRAHRHERRPEGGPCGAAARPGSQAHGADQEEADRRHPRALSRRQRRAGDDVRPSAASGEPAQGAAAQGEPLQSEPRA